MMIMITILLQCISLSVHMLQPLYTQVIAVHAAMAVVIFVVVVVVVFIVVVVVVVVVVMIPLPLPLHHHITPLIHFRTASLLLPMQPSRQGHN